MGLVTSALRVAVWLGGPMERPQCPGQHSCLKLLPFLPGGITGSSFPLSADSVSQVNVERHTGKATQNRVEE